MEHQALSHLSMCEGMIEVRLDVYGEMLGGPFGIWAAVTEGMKEFCGIQ